MTSTAGMVLSTPGAVVSTAGTLVSTPPVVATSAPVVATSGLGGFDSSLGRLPDPSVGGISTLRHRDRPAVKTAAPAQLMPPAL